jgi:hypothetical protein
MAVVIGCSGPPIEEDGLLGRNWGRSLETMRYMQMVDPEAGKNLDPALGLNGIPSENNVNKYQESFKDQSQEQSETILKLQ